jgi:hypothetical protein
MGGGSGHLYIYGGVINATADNPAYDEDGNPVQRGGLLQCGRQPIRPEGLRSRHREWVWNTYYTYTDQEYARSFADGVSTGKMPGYVIGSACENANSYYENTQRKSLR